MAKHVQDIDRGLKRFIRELEVAKNTEVVIGLQEGDTNGELSIAQYGAYNEYGTQDIPERSFMRSTFDEQSGKLSRLMNSMFNRVKAGQMSTCQALGLIGLRHQDDIQKKISSDIKPANSPATIERKKSSRTLIDTGAMRAAVRYIVRRSK